jgi:hypothetical protein
MTKAGADHVGTSGSGALVLYDSASYFSTVRDSGGVWRCPIVPPQFDEAVWRAEEKRQGRGSKLGPVITTTRAHDGGTCDCGKPYARHEDHSVRCAVRFVGAPKPAPKPQARTSAWTVSGFTSTGGY